MLLRPSGNKFGGTNRTLQPCLLPLDPLCSGVGELMLPAALLVPWGCEIMQGKTCPVLVLVWWVLVLSLPP